MDLAAWMAERGLTDQAVADEVGVTRPYITRIRNGVVHPNLGTALRIWDYVNREIDLEYLLPMHSRPKPKPKPKAPAKPRAKRPAVVA
jgi:transcriptional regulator with XRE-family HTH domain